MTKNQYLSYTIIPTQYSHTTKNKNSTSMVETLLSPQVCINQLEWLTNLVSTIATQIVIDHYNPTDLTELYIRGLEKTIPATDVSEKIQGFPTQGYAAARSLGWYPSVKLARQRFGVYLPDRVLRMSVEYAIRTLRSTARRYIITQALLDNPADHKTAISELKDKYGLTVERAEYDNRIKSIRNYTKKHNKIPESLCVLEEPPICIDLLLAAAADKQWQRLVQKDRELVLEFKVPIVEYPQKPKDYTKINVCFLLPTYIENNTNANSNSEIKVHTPTIRLSVDKKGVRQIRLDVSYSAPTLLPDSLTKRNHAPAMGVDWGTKSLVTFTIGHKSKNNKLVVDSQPMFYNIELLAHKLQSLKTLQNILQHKISAWKALISNVYDPVQIQYLQDKIEHLELERINVNAKRSNINTHLGHVVAVWIIRAAVLARVRTIFIEDLTTLSFDSRMWTPWAEIVTDTIRGKIFGFLQDWCNRLGIKLETVHPANTSKTCSKCSLGSMEFFKHSTCIDVGHVWAKCSNCSYTVHRDYNASVNILSAGLFKNTTKRFRQPEKYTHKYVTTRTIPDKPRLRKESKKERGLVTPKQHKRTKTTRNTNSSHNNYSNNNSKTSNKANSKASSNQVSISYRHPSLWRLLGNNCSPKPGQVIQVESGGLYPLVIPSQIQLRQPQTVASGICL